MPVVVLPEPSSEKNTDTENHISIPKGAEVSVKVVKRFSKEEVFSAFVSSPSFRKIVMNGKYVYIDGYIVVDSPECLRLQKRQARIHPIAISNPDDYLLQKKIITVYDQVNDSEKFIH